jgi:hypothetical protein
MSLPAILGALDVDLVVVPRNARPTERRSLSADTADRFERRALPQTGEC